MAVAAVLPDTVLNLAEECPKQPLILPQFYTWYFDRDLGGCDIGSITLGMNDTVEIFDNGKAGSGKSDLLC